MIAGDFDPGDGLSPEFRAKPALHFVANMFAVAGHRARPLLGLEYSVTSSRLAVFGAVASSCTAGYRRKVIEKMAVAKPAHAAYGAGLADHVGVEGRSLPSEHDPGVKFHSRLHPR